MLGELLEFLGGVEGEHAHSGRMGALDGRYLLDGITVADRPRPRAGGEAELDLLEARRIERAAEADEPLQDRGGRVGFHRIIDARQRQRVGQPTIVLLHTIDVEHEAGGRKRMISHIAGDLRGHRD